MCLYVLWIQWLEVRPSHIPCFYVHLHHPSWVLLHLISFVLWRNRKAVITSCFRFYRPQRAEELGRMVLIESGVYVEVVEFMYEEATWINARCGWIYVWRYVGRLCPKPDKILKANMDESRYQEICKFSGYVIMRYVYGLTISLTHTTCLKNFKILLVMQLIQFLHITPRTNKWSRMFWSQIHIVHQVVEETNESPRNMKIGGPWNAEDVGIFDTIGELARKRFKSRKALSISCIILFFVVNLRDIFFGLTGQFAIV